MKKLCGPQSKNAIATPAGAWTEAHNSPGAAATGPRWAVAEGEAGGETGVQTYVLVANTASSRPPPVQPFRRGLP